MKPIVIDLGRVDDHGVPRRDLHKLIDEIETRAFEVQESQGIRSIKAQLTIEPEREADE